MSQRATFAIAGGGSADSGSNGQNGGRFAYNGGNEVELDSYDNDPVMYRRGMRIDDAGGGGGADSWDSLPNGPGGRRVQMILVHGEQSEAHRGNPGNAGGSWNLFINDGLGEGDANMRRVFRLEAVTSVSRRDGSVIEAFYLGEHQWESLVRQMRERMTGTPLPMPNDDGEAGFPNKLVSPDGRLELDIQNSDAPEATLYFDKIAIASMLGGVTAAGSALLAKDPNWKAKADGAAAVS